MGLKNYLDFIKLILLFNGIKQKEIIARESHKVKPSPIWSSIFPAVIGAITALIPKHCENKAIAIPLFDLEEACTIPSVAVGRNEVNPIAIEISAMIIKYIP